MDWLHLCIRWRFIWECTNHQSKALLMSYNWSRLVFTLRCTFWIQCQWRFKKNIQLIKLYQSITWSWLLYKNKKNYQASSYRWLFSLLACQPTIRDSRGVFFEAACLRCNLHTIKFTHLKYAIQWFLVYLQICGTHNLTIELFHHPKKNPVDIK